MTNNETVNEIISEIISETDYTEKQVRPRTITRFLEDENMNPEKILAIYMVSEAYYESFIGNGASLPHNIPIGLLKEFADQFFPEDYDSESLNDAVKSLVEYATSSTKNKSERRIYCQHGSHITCLVRNAIELGKENAIFSYEDFIDFLSGYDDTWYMCEVLELPHAV